MAYKFQCLAEDGNRYLQSFRLFLERSSEHQCMLDFIRGVFSDILASIGEGISSLNVLGVGSGAGEIDLEMLSQLHRTHPGLMVDNEVVEPSSDMLLKYKASVSKASNLDHVLFKWNEMTASEFENHWREKNLTKKMDFIHMIEMLYYVPNPHAAVTFFRSLLKKNGKLMIILVSEKSGWGKLWKTYQADLCKGDISQCLTTGDVKSFLDADGVKYKSFQLPSQMDITECFIEGNEKGDLLLDFLTEVAEFRKCAPPDLKEGVLDLLQHPDCSTEMEGRIVFDNTLEVLVLDA